MLKTKLINQRFPRLLQAYYTEKDNDLWNNEVKKSFFRELGEELTRKISERIEEE